MDRRSYSSEHIINKLREAEVLISQGIRVGQASRQIGVTEQTLRYARGQALLPLAQRVWRDAHRAGAEAEGA